MIGTLCSHMSESSGKLLLHSWFVLSLKRCVLTELLAGVLCLATFASYLGICLLQNNIVQIIVEDLSHPG